MPPDTSPPSDADARYAVRSPVLRAVLGIGIGIIIVVAAFAGFMAWVLRTDTTHAPGYDERVFTRLEIGTPRADVIAKLGEPIDGGMISAIALPPGKKVVGDDDILEIEDLGGIMRIHGTKLRDPDGKEKKIWRRDRYSRQGPKGTHYLMRHVIYDEQDRVAALYKEFYFD